VLPASRDALRTFAGPCDPPAGLATYRCLVVRVPASRPARALGRRSPMGRSCDRPGRVAGSGLATLPGPGDPTRL